MIARAASVVVAIAALATGCKPHEAAYVASCDLSAADPAKSGNPTTMKECIDYSDAREPLTVDDANKFCGDLGGVLLSAKCPIAGAASRCRPNDVGNAEFVFYPPTVPADATHACKIMQGTLGKP